MKSQLIPFSPVPLSVAKKMSRSFMGLGVVFSRAFPYLKIELEQAGIDASPEEYGTIMLFLLVFYFVIFSLLVWMIGIKTGTENSHIIGLTVGGLLGLLVVVQLSLYPKMKVRKRVKDIEKNLVFALRTILVQIKSGVSMFDSLVMVSSGDYGAVSTEFKKAVDEINTGTREEDALQKLAMKNPSLFFRRSLWQIVNGLKAGVDVGTVFAELVGTITKEQRVQVQRYGSQLRLYSLMYMMLGVIIPALGLTFLIVLSSFPQIETPEFLFWLLLAVVIIGQFMYIGMVKAKRPNLLGE